MHIVLFDYIVFGKTFSFFFLHFHSLEKDCLKILSWKVTSLFYLFISFVFDLVLGYFLRICSKNGIMGERKS